MSGPLSEVRIFVRPLPIDVRRSEVEDLFGKYGKLNDVKILRGYGFVEFSANGDAQGAVDELNNSDFHGQSLQVEFAKEKSERPRDRDDRNNRYRDREPRRNDRNDRNDRFGSQRNERSGGGYRVIVTGIPEDTPWQELKDFARSADVQVHYANCRKGDGTGIVEFNSRDDMERAISSLDSKDFRGQSVNVKEDPRPPPPSSGRPPYGGRRDDFRRGGGGGRRGGYNDRRRSRSRSGDRRGGYDDRRRDYNDDREKNGRSYSRSRSRSPVNSRRSPSPPRGNSPGASAPPAADDGTW